MTIGAARPNARRSSWIARARHRSRSTRPAGRCCGTTNGIRKSPTSRRCWAPSRTCSRYCRRRRNSPRNSVDIQAAPGESDAMAHSIFISLTHQDTPIAAALEEALHALVGADLDVKYAGGPKVGSGPKSGENWMTWIVDQVKNCDFALVLLTPASI